MIRRIAAITIRVLALVSAGVLPALLALHFWIYPLPVEKLTRAHGQFVYDRDGHLMTAYTSEDRFWRRPVNLDEVSPRLVSTVIACEDQWFYRHLGVNPFSLASAAINNITEGEVVRGGSTITMQIARMMEPKERTIFNKLCEIGRAIQLELKYSKVELLEIYFNLVPYGGNIEGVGAATMLYFGKGPDSLSWSECAVLAAIPVSPTVNRPDRDVEACRIRRDHILTRLLSLDIIDSTDYRLALAEEIPTNRLQVEPVAPHFCRSLVEQYPNSTVLHSTIDAETQKLCERLVDRHHARLSSQHIYNLSVVVIDNARAEIVAMVGSPDFGDTRHHGQVNGALAPRSPGSALKPFVYAMALDSGLMSPAHIIPDIPVNYNGYAPDNYDEEFHGLVSLREALIRSYNIPAVKVCKEVGLAEFHDKLRQGGLITLSKPYHHYGLPLVLGSGEVTLLELSTLYASFARDGRRTTPRWVTGIDAPSSLRTGNDHATDTLFTPETCYIISDILSDLRRPDLPTTWESTLDIPRVAWKTGTSYGRRDAWAIGYTPHFTVGVWAGNFSGAGSVDLVGAESSAPLMLDIFCEISRGVNSDWFALPEGVGVRQVCAESGMPANERCPSLTSEFYVKGRSPLITCTVHSMVLVDAETGQRTSRALSAREGIRLVEEVVAQWPADVSSWLRDHGYEPVASGSGRLTAGGDVGSRRSAPVISSPAAGSEFVLIDDVPPEYQQLLLEAAVAGDAHRVHWFLDRQLIRSCEIGERAFWTPSRGRHELMCVDDAGRSARVCFVVK